MVAADTRLAAVRPIQIVRLTGATDLLEPLEGAQQPHLRSHAHADGATVGDYRQGG
jgi:hypothetical protein